MPKNLLLREIEFYARMKYPRPGHPCEITRATSWKNNPTPPEFGWLPRIELSESEGIYDQNLLATGEEAMEESVNISAFLKKKLATSGKF